jgi:hypothetical protein
MFFLRLLALAPLVLVLSTGLRASCCSSASSNGIGRLLPYERASVEFYNDMRLAVGNFNDQGVFKKGILRHLPHWQLSHELHVMGRIANFFQPFMKIPLKMSISALKTQSRLGDITLGARWPLISENLIAHLPALSLVSSLQIPTAYEPYWLSAGVVLDKSFGMLSLSFNYGLSLDATYFSKQGYKPGIKHAAGLQTGFLIAHDHRVNLGCALSLQGRARNSAGETHLKYNIALTTSYAWAFHSHATLLTGLGAHLPVAYCGRNTNSEIFAQAGLRIGIF